jgi:hypothetical protein
MLFIGYVPGKNVNIQNSNGTPFNGITALDN